MDQDYILRLEDVLKSTLSTNSHEIFNATKILKNEYFVESKSLVGLLHIMQSSENPQIRQLSAIEARKLIAIFWEDLSKSLKCQIKKSLLQSIVLEPVSIVRHSSARVISSIAKIDLPVEEWKDLPIFIHQASLSHNFLDRETGLYILYVLFEIIEEMFIDKMEELFSLLKLTINDKESYDVRMTTLMILGKVGEIIDRDDKQSIKSFQEIFPSMFLVLKETINSNNENFQKNAFEVFNTLLICEGALISKAIKDLLEFMVHVASTTKLDDSVRCMALNFLITCSRYRKNKIQALKLGPQLILSMLLIGTEEDTGSPDDDSPSRLAFRCIDILSISLPPSHVFIPLMNYIPQYLQSENPGYRKSALTALGVAIEGSSNFVSTQFSYLLTLIIIGLKDNYHVVKRAALLALGQFADELPEETSERHAELMPILLELILDSHEETKKSALNTLDALLESLDSNSISNYFSCIMERLLGLFQSNSTLEIKSTVVAAIGSAVYSAKDQFSPYFERTIECFIPVLELKDSEDELELRGMVTDTLGTIAETVGKEKFTPYIEYVVQSAYRGMQIDHPRLRECLFCFFAILARVYKHEFAPFLHVVIPALIQSLDKDDSDDIYKDSDENDSIKNFDNDKDDTLLDMSKVNSAITMEKEIAVDALGEICSHTKELFIPYLEESKERLINLSTHFYEGVRKAAISSLWRFTATLYNISNPQQWLPGLPLKIPLHTDVDKFATSVRDITIEILEDESERLVVIEICQNISETLKVCGPGILGDAESIQKISEHILQILKKQHISQLDEDIDNLINNNENDDYVENDDKDIAEYDALLIDSAIDVLISISHVLGEEYSQTFGFFLPHILKYYESETANDRSMVISGLGEIIDGLKAGITPYTEQIFHIFMKALDDNNEEIRSNAACSMGLLCQYSKYDLTSQYMTIFSKLQSLFSNNNHKNAKDNAIGCVSRLIISHPASVPLTQILPLLVSFLPLQNDYSENFPVYSAILKLYKLNDINIISLTERLIPIFATVLGPPEEQLTEPIRNELIELVRALNANYSEIISQYPCLLNAIR
ncbi:hypothetical protein PNEG_02074 [Pneumocystis murina B123]|uniref:Importin N-terminal domain-containing protein n=1 Tax=Pneumocystis murina (strain B123) TaxID=1069680 RepID=M7NQU9_PNEMU|nr:hypothetical protein PNEG_02074 [Pneumocystis murina B123]EMR09486.1 hypothetical protein PNEG_02074 [Pneumocystis murina B123]